VRAFGRATGRRLASPLGAFRRRFMLEATRLYLRDFAPGDVDAVHAYASDPLVTRYTAFGPNTEAETRNFVDRVVVEASTKPRRSHTLAVIHSSSRQLIGGCSLELADSVGPQYVLGYCLHSGYWGQGLGFEAVRRILVFGFSELSAWRIYAPVFLGNEASARLLQRLDFRLEGTHRQSTFARGAWHDEMVFALLKAEWREPGA